jgi:hypothetical protein
VVNRGGENVYCAEVENALAAHPAIAEVAVFGVPDDALGRKVAAAVVPLAGARVTPAELAAFARGVLADFKVPQYIDVRPDPLPRNAGGKVIKARLRDETPWGRPVRLPSRGPDQVRAPSFLAGAGELAAEFVLEDLPHPTRARNRHPDSPQVPPATRAGTRLPCCRQSRQTGRAAPPDPRVRRRVGHVSPVRASSSPTSGSPKAHCAATADSTSHYNMRTLTGTHYQPSRSRPVRIRTSG